MTFGEIALSIMLLLGAGGLGLVLGMIEKEFRKLEISDNVAAGDVVAGKVMVDSTGASVTGTIN